MQQDSVEGQGLAIAYNSQLAIDIHEQLDMQRVLPVQDCMLIRFPSTKCSVFLGVNEQISWSMVMAHSFGWLHPFIFCNHLYHGLSGFYYEDHMNKFNL